MFTFYDDEDEYEEEWDEEEYEEDEDEFDDWDDEYEDDDEEEEDWDDEFEEEDQDDEDDEDMESWEESATFVCEDCGYRWTEEDNDNEIIACPMCGSDNITQID